jgi:hypothetical protein
VCLEQFASLSWAAARAAEVGGNGDRFEVCGCPDTAGGRRECLGLLERRVDWGNPRLAGRLFPKVMATGVGGPTRFP